MHGLTMALEIERKFLVLHENFLEGHQGTLLRQGYIRTENTTTVRVRTAGSKGFLCLKGPTKNLTRLEYEYEVPLQDATEMLATLCDLPLIEKTRYRIEVDGMLWEV
ncbi:MAG: CYTH domain-containing protein, partial [Polyangiaceae bacterium]|nr:CYTH domain-containing protein [Polyangiaceae bacterium]